MHRSSSWSRVTDEEYNYMHTPPPMASTILRMGSLQGSEMYDNQTYDSPSDSETTRKEKTRAKFAENAVHFIPLVLLICAAVLWFFSNPDVVDVGRSKRESIAVKIEGMTIEGDLDLDTDADGTQTGVLPLLDLDLGDSDSSSSAVKHHNCFRDDHRTTGTTSKCSKRKSHD